MATKGSAVTAAKENRVASRGKRDRTSFWGGRLTNPDLNLRRYSRDDIGLITRVLYQFPDVAGYCSMWGQSVLATDRVIKPAKGNTAAEQDLADAAALRAATAWVRVQDSPVALLKVLLGRYYGFSRAEEVLRFDEVAGEWIHDLYDVPQEAWKFDPDGREFLVTTDAPSGIEVDPSRFLHFQWGSLDTKYGEGDLAKAYLPLWKIQKLETMLLRRIEDNDSMVVVHIPKWIQGPERQEIEDSYAKEFSRVLIVPSEEQVVRTELPTLGITTSGAAGRQEMDAIRLYERWVQIALLGAPMTGDKAMGTGKLEETRKRVWDDKTPLGSALLDACLTRHWLDAYCRVNLADLPPRLRPRFESDATDVQNGLTGVAAQIAADLGVKLAARQITATFAEELLAAIGIPRSRAKAMVASTIAERATLNVVTTDATGGAVDPATVEPPEPEAEPAEPDADDGDEEAA